MSEPDWPALFRSMQEQLGMLQAEFIELKDTSVSKASLHDIYRPAQHLGTVMQTAVQEALGTRVQCHGSGLRGWTGELWKLRDGNTLYK